jgi:hypothetical protein
MARQISVLVALLVAGSTLSATSLAARAASITVQNFDFSSPSEQSPPFFSGGSTATQATNAAITGWGANILANTKFGSDGVQDDGNSENPTMQSAYINGGNPTGNTGPAIGNSIYQDVGALTPYTTYTLTVGVGVNGGFGNIASLLAELSLVNGTTDTGTALARIGYAPTGTGSFTDESLTFSTGGNVSGDLTIVLSNVTPDDNSTANQVDFSNVRLAAVPVPEPSSLIALCGLSAMGLFLFARRRRGA